MCSLCRKSQWVGAKAIAKLMKPKKEGSREKQDSAHERLRSAPDMPLPEIPNILDNGSTLPTPSLPPRQTRLSLDSPGSNSLEENHIHSSPNVNHRGKNIQLYTTNVSNHLIYVCKVLFALIIWSTVA